jgi:hypothetical protein
MACQTIEKTIQLGGQDRKLTVTQLPSMRAVKLLARLGRVAGPGLALLASGDASRLGDAVRMLFAELSEAEVEHLIAELLFEGARVEVGGQMVPVKVAFASEFAGEMLAIVEALKVALEANYGSFFGGLAGLIPAGLRRASGSNMSSTSAGPLSG